jgi:iron-sulfur cluster repair protein YtfE (RIC family)
VVLDLNEARATKHPREDGAGMTEGTLSAALEREHREIDAGVDAFRAGLARGEVTAEPLLQAMSALRRHIYLEEEFVVPPLRAAGMVPPIFVMLREHGELWTTMDTLEGQLAEDPAGEAASATCQMLTVQLQTHNDKEEPIIYPQVDATLEPQAREQLGAFLESGAMPEGWVAERAR